MLALYLAALGFGGTMILVSLLLGGADKDLSHADGGADHDASHDHDGSAHHDGSVDHDHDHGAHEAADKDAVAGWWLLSLRFWTFGLAAFGLAGSLLTLFAVPAILTALVALVAGGGAGLGAATFFRALNRDSVSGEVDLGRLAGEEGRVVLPIRPGAEGKIVVASMSGRVELIATTRDAEMIPVGTPVIIAGVTGGIADVSRLPGAVPGAHQDAERRAALAAQSSTRSDRSGV
ncbi:MAG: hypothetical protein ABMB14_16910 [Myxococcota bacterium]